MDSNTFLGLFAQVEAEPIPVDWKAVETHLGVGLPADYKALAAFGPLDIGEFVWLYTPCVQAELDHLDAFDYADWLKKTHRHCRIASRDGGFEPPPFHPAPGGLLAWGRTRSSCYLFWDTYESDDPDLWPVVVFDTDAVYKGADPWRIYELPLLETLALMIRGGITLPSGRTVGPLPPTARRTAFLPAVTSWAPPEPAPERVPEAGRRAALTEGTGLAALRLLAPPPDKPYLGDGTWDALFETLGTRLPDEYVELMNIYGTGCFTNWLRFTAPTRSDYRGLVQTVTTTNDDYRELREEFPEDYSLAAWPEPGGFLPFADSINGDQLGWLTQGDPDQWPLIVFPRHADQRPPLPGTLIETLLTWMRGQLDSAGFATLDPDDDPLDFLGFTPTTADDFDKQERNR